MHGIDFPQGDAADYELLELQVASLLEDERDFIANAANFAAFLYYALPNVNWAGFYFPGEDGLVLGPFGGKPACTRLPSGRGVCGRAFQSAQSVIVDDVNAFADHIVCDSASRSELVVPLLHQNAVYGVFDIDSPALARFTDRDKTGVERLVARFIQHTPLPERFRTRHLSSDRLNERIDLQTCRDHHVMLVYLLEELSKADTAPAAAFSLLQRFRSVLLAHLKIEDDHLYPRLTSSANAIVREKAARYRQEMGGLRRQFDALWNKWPADAIEQDFASWQSEWSGFAQSLTARIENEDRDLYVAAEAGLS